MKTTRPFRARILAGSIAASFATLLAAPFAVAQLQWDPSLTPLTPSGGTGAWNTVNPFWSNGATDQAWDNLVATFGGVAGVVTINNSGFGISATGLTFDVTGYTIAAQTAGDVLSLTGAPVITVNGLATDTATISANITGGSGLAKAGAGILVLSGTNNFTGGLAVNGGTLTVSSDANLGNAAGGVTLDGGTLNITSAIATARQITLGTTLGSTVTTTGGTSIWTGQIIGAGGFVKNGASALQLGGATGNTFNGLVNVNQGTLFLSKTSGNAIGTGGVTITSNSTAGFGAATVSLSANEQIDDSAPLELSASGGLRAGLDLNGFTETVGPVTISSVTLGSATIALGATGKLILTQDLVFNNNRNATANTGREVMITGTGNYTTTGVGGTLDLGGGLRTITVNANNAQLNSDATIEAVIDNGSLIKAGARVLRLGATNTYGGTTTVTNGTLRALVATAIPAGSNLFVTGATAGTTATLDFNGFNFTPVSLTLGGGGGANAVATGAGTLTLANDVIYDATNSPQTSTISGLVNFAAPRTFNIADSAGTTTELLISANISGAGTGLTKNGNGVLALSGSNNFTGPILVTGGALAVRAANTVTGNVQLNGGALQFDTALADSTAFNSILGAATNGVVVGASGGSVIVNHAAAADRTLTGRLFTLNGPLTFDITRNEASTANQLRLAAGSNTNVFTGSSTITKNGDGRLTLNSNSPGFSGAWVINAGTVEVVGAQLGDNSATNTVTINGLTGGATQLGNLANSATITQNITLAGGAISAHGGTVAANNIRIYTGAVGVTAASSVFLNDFWRDAGGIQTINADGVWTGGGGLTVGVNRASFDYNSGAFRLTNAANTLGGTLRIEKNLNVENNSTTGVGKTIGTMNVTLAGGHLNLRDNGAGSNGTLAYGNNVSVEAPAGGGDLAGIAGLTADRSTGANVGNTLQLGTLGIGTDQLDVSALDGYKITFAGLTTFTGTPTLNVTAGVLTLAGGLSATGLTFTKTGAGTLRLLGAVDYASYTLTGGTIEVPVAPAGAARDIAIPFGSGFSAGFAATQANLIDRVTFDSAGVVALGVDATFNPDFTGFTGGLRLGGTGNATLTGTITPADGTVRLGGAGGTLTLASVNAVSGGANLDVNINGTTAGTVALAAANNFSGTTSIGGGMTLRVANDDSLGLGVTAIAIDNGTLQLASGGNFAAFGTRSLSVGTSGAAVDTDGNAVTLGTALLGAGTFSKTGAGTLTLTNTAGTFAGKVAVRAGTLSISADANLGAAAALTADRLTLAGGTLQATGTFTIPVNRGVTLGAGGGTFDVTGANVLTLASVMVGANPFTKEGTGTLRITADPNNTGLYTINAGVVEFQHTGSTDANMVVNNTGTLRVLTAGALGDAYSITTNAGGTFDVRVNETVAQVLGNGTITNDSTTAAATLGVNSATNATFSGVIKNGASFALGLAKSGTNTVTLTGTNTYTGATTMNSGRIAVEGAAGALGNTAITVGDNNGSDESITFGQTTDVWISGALNRIGDTGGSVTLNGRVPLTYTGPRADSTGFNETLLAITTSNAFNTLTVIPGAAAPAAPGVLPDVQLTPTSLLRANSGTLLVRGSGLGTTGAGSTRVVPGTIATIGAGGVGGSQTQSIVPWIVGDNSATGIGQTFVTNDPVTGLRPLTNGEFASTLAGAQTSRNVSVGGGETVVANTAINALRVTGGTTTIGAGSHAAVRSGAVLFTNGGTIAGPGWLEFGTTDGIITNANNAQTTATLGARLGGTGGLTYSSAGLTTNVLTLSGDNTFVGNLTINSGTVQLGSATALNQNYPVAVIARPGTVFAINGFNAAVRNLQTVAGTGAAIQNGAATPATLTTYLTAAQTVNTVFANGGTGVLNLVFSGGTSALTITADASATGTAEVRTGTLTLNGANGTINDMGAVSVQGGATLQLTNTSTANNTNRINNATALTLNGGTLDFDNNASAIAISESIASLALGAGANAIIVDKGNSVTNSAVLTFTSTFTRNAGATLNLSSQNNGTAIFDLGTLGNSRLVFTSSPVDDGIIGGWATIDSSASTREFVKNVADADTVTAGAQPSATALVAADYTATLSSGANPAQNVKITATPIALSSATQINSLNLPQATATTVDIGAANTLRVESGGIIVSGAFSSTIFSNGILTAGNGVSAGGDLVFHTIPTNNAAVTFTNSTDTVSLGNVVNGTPVVFTAGLTPGGLTTGVTYYVVNSTATTFQVALAPGGAVVPITADGTNAAFNRLYNSTVNSVIGDNGTVNLVKAGGSTLVLAAANTYTGKTYINGGTLRISADNNLGGGIGTFTSDKLVLSNGGILDVTSSFTLDANRGMTLGGGSNIVSIAAGTAGNGKTLTYNGAIVSSGAGEGSIQFRANVATTSGIDPGKIAANLSALNITGSFRADAGTVTLNGASNTVGRSLQIGMDGTGSLTYTGAANSLTVGKGITDTLDVGFSTSNVLNTTGTLNLAGLGQFTANVDQVRLGAASANFTGQALVTLANNNDITAGTQFIVGLTPGGSGNSALTSTLTFGSGTNNITTRTMTIGGDKSKVTATVAAGGTVNLNGFGTNTLDLLVSNYLNTGTAGITNIFDLTGGTLNASVNTLTVAQKTGGNAGGNTGILTITGNSNNISANALVIGRLDGNNAAGTNATNGTVNFGGGTMVVNNDVSLGLWTNNTVGTPTVSGTLNITGGTVTVGGNIVTTNSASATATLNLDGGTLDLTNGTVSVDAFTAKSGVLRDIAGLFAGDGTTPAALTKTTGGTLTLNGQQNYGTLNANAGTTVVNSAIGTGSSTINAGSTTNINAAQSLAALNIVDGVVVTFGAGPGPAPAPLAVGFAAESNSTQTLSALKIDSGAAGSAVVPEPGTCGLLLVGALGMLSRRRQQM